MTQAAPAVFKIPTKSPQPARGKAGRPSGRARAGRPAPGRVVANGTGRAATRGGGEVIELEYGITVYPAREEHGRWRAVWYEDGQRQQCEAASEEKLAPKLEKITERLQADAPDMKRPGADLIAHYLDPDRLPVDERWSRKHAHTQRRLCERFAAPVIGAVTCQDITTEHTPDNDSYPGTPHTREEKADMRERRVRHARQPDRLPVTMDPSAPHSVQFPERPWCALWHGWPLVRRERVGPLLSPAARRGRDPGPAGSALRPGRGRRRPVPRPRAVRRFRITLRPRTPRPPGPGTAGRTLVPPPPTRGSARRAEATRAVRAAPAGSRSCGRPKGQAILRAFRSRPALRTWYPSNAGSNHSRAPGIGSVTGPDAADRRVGGDRCIVAYGLSDEVSGVMARPRS
jgi:hypothetical protein